MGADARMPWVVRHPWAVLALATAFLGGSLALLARFRIDPNVEHLLPPDDPTVLLTRRLQGGSPPSRVLVVSVRAPTVPALDAVLPSVVSALRASPHLASVRATREEFVGPSRWAWYGQAPVAFLPEESLAALRDRLIGPGRRAEVESAKRRIAEDALAGTEVVRRDPLGTRWILAGAAERMPVGFPSRLAPGTSYLVFENPPLALLLATGKDDSFVLPFARALLEDVEDRLAVTVAGTSVRTELAGGYVTAVWQESAMRRDMEIETIFSVILVVVFLVWFTRSLAAAHLVFVPVSLAIVGTLALGGAILGPLTPLVASAAAVLVAQGIDYPVHLFVRFREARAGLGRDEAVGAALRSVTRPLAGVCVTTMAAFLALLASRFPGYRQFGIVLSIGLGLCLLGTLGLFPVLLRLVDRGERPAKDHTPWLVRAAASGAAGRSLTPVLVLAVLVGLAGWGITLARGLRIDLDLRNSMAPGDPGGAVLEGLERDLGASLLPVFALVDARTPVEEIRREVDGLCAAGAVAAAHGVQSLVATAEGAARAEAFRRETAGWVEAALEDLVSAGFRPEPFRAPLSELAAVLARDAPGLERLERPEFDGLRRSLRVEAEGRSWWVVTFQPRRSLWSPTERAAFDAGVRGALGEDVRLFSAFHLPDHTAASLGGDLLRVAGLTAAALLVLTVLAVGSIPDGLRALVPVSLATGVTLGVATLLGGAINPINMGAVPLILGVGVDGGVQYLCRLRQDPRRDRIAALLDVGPAVWGSTVTTLLGFGAIASAKTPGLISMGILVSAGAASSLIATLFALPALVPRRRPA